MPRTCSICAHRDRAEIDGLLIGSGPMRAIADQYGLSRTSLLRHRGNCISAQLSKAKELQESGSAFDLVQRLREIHQETRAILSRAKKTKDWATALRAISRLERQIELEGALLGQLDRGGRGGDLKIEVVYRAAAGRNLPDGTHESPQSFGDAKVIDMKTNGDSTCDPLLSQRGIAGIGHTGRATDEG